MAGKRCNRCNLGLGEPTAAKPTPTIEEVVIDAADAGASIKEIAAYLNTDEKWLIRKHGRKIAQAYARRVIRLRRAQTEQAIKGAGTTISRLLQE